MLFWTHSLRICSDENDRVIWADSCSLLLSARLAGTSTIQSLVCYLAVLITIELISCPLWSTFCAVSCGFCEVCLSADTGV